MNIRGRIVGGKFQPFSKEDMLPLAKFEGKDVELEVKPVQRTRTSQQNKALHVYLQLVADALNEAAL
ncbi:MAG: hypothetical protein WDN67_00745 [Candidatus Moraniibacteriota bacterium]